jgi:hypothetical protein
VDAFDRRANQDRYCGEKPESRKPIFVDENTNRIDIAATYIARTLRGWRSCS